VSRVQGLDREPFHVADPTMSSSARVDKRIWWFTVLNAADKSRRMSTDGRDEALATRRDSFTASRAVSLECAALKPD